MLGEGGAELGRDAGHRVPEDLVHEVEGGAHLIRHRGADGAGALGEPEPGDLGAEPGQGVLALARQEIEAAQLPERLPDALELRQDGAALGLGRMGGQHQLDLEMPKEQRHLVGGHPRARSCATAAPSDSPIGAGWAARSRWRRAHTRCASSARLTRSK